MITLALARIVNYDRKLCYKLSEIYDGTNALLHNTAVFIATVKSFIVQAPVLSDCWIGTMTFLSEFECYTDYATAAVQTN
jgi:hypothetical protein